MFADLSNYNFQGKFMFEKRILFGFVVLFSVSFVFARDVTERSVENMNSWQETFDISGKAKKKKKYNVVVTAKDKGGNTTVGGPFNIYIDPDSDKPVTSITNPENDLRVPANLNIVGICFDDDGVDYVELILDGDYENPVRAKGKEFWSHFIDTTALEEGDHTIEAYGVDINGLRGDSVKHRWCLDRRAPMTSVNNYAMGTLVSGNVKLEGLISDGNGISLLEYSLDEGVSFQKVPIKKVKNSTDATFSLSVDTRKLDDGPAVIWFFARDKQGSIGFYPFLLFIDNTKPEIQITYPADKQSVAGVFTAAGIARDVVALKSLKWAYGGESGEFELTPGNPYWTKEFTDLKNIKNGKLTITAEDTVGNVSVVERNIIVDYEADRPKVTIDWPKDGASFADDADVFVRGIAVDDDSVKEVKISVDGMSLGTVETQSTFYKNLLERKSLGGGKHTVTVSAVDIYGIEGPAASVSFNTTGDAPYFNSIRVVGGAGAGDLPYGMELNPEQGGNIEIEAGTSTGIAEAWYSVAKAGTSAPRKDISISNNETKKVFSIPIASLPWGVVDLTYHVKDTMGREAQYSTCVYVSNLTDIKPASALDLPDFIEDEMVRAKIVDINGTPYSKGMRIDISPDAKATPVNLLVDITSDAALAVNYRIFGAARTGEKESYEGKATIIRPDKKSPNQQAVINLAGMPARATNIELTVTNGKDYSNTFGTQILIGREHPADEIQDDKGVYWICNADSYFSSEFNSYILPKKIFAAYVNAQNPVNVSVIGGNGNIAASVENNMVYLSCLAPGNYRGMQIRATDAEGHTYASPSVNLIATDDGPQITMTSPLENAWVKNSASVKGDVVDNTGIVALEYSLNNGESWNAIPFRQGATSVPLAFELNLNSIPEGLVPIDIRAQNASGQISYYRSAVCKDVTPPEIQVVVPVPEDVVNGQNTIAMLVMDAGPIIKAEYAPAGNNNVASRKEIAISSMPATVVGTEDKPLNSAMQFIYTDAAGNEARISKYDFIVDRKSDLPVVEIQLPTESQVITTDFTISGVALDDDGPSLVFYKIDDNPFQQVSQEFAYSFKVDVPITSVTDNEHTITMYAVDVNGMRGEETVSKFRVSLAEPVIVMTAPDISTTQKEITTLRGTASDKNGIKSVEISLDNGNSYNIVEGTTNWSYTFDTRALPDGTRVVFVRATDNYDVQSLYSTQLTLDNTRPEINLELPLDDSQTSGKLFFSGFALDDIALKELYISIASLDGRRVPPNLARIDLNVDTVITETVDMTALENGNYNVKVSGVDAAGNITSASRSIRLDKSVAAASVDIYYPLNGERKQGAFTIFGAVRSESKVTQLTLLVDGKELATTEPNVTNYYKFPINAGALEEGMHRYAVRASLENGTAINSMEQTFDYLEYGPWVRIENFDYGDFAYERPVIKGTAGYSISEYEIEAAKMKGATKDQKEELAMRSVKCVEISWDNGRTFTQISKKEKWSYRIEDEDLPAGYHFMLVRAKMNNGEIAITRCIVQIDKQAPFVRIISPGVGGHYNQELMFSGLTNDNVGLKEVTLSLRKGDKSSYEVPAFFQGLYIDASFWGATLFDIGLGLTFFDDNVRIQFNFGQFTKSQWQTFNPGTTYRYGGDCVLGFKIIANVANLPFGWLFGHDWDWLSANLALGASFKHFNDSGSGAGGMLSAVIAQLEFPRAHFKKWKAFKTMSFYTEFQLWFIPSDVADLDAAKNLAFQVSFGVRANVF